MKFSVVFALVFLCTLANAIPFAEFVAGNLTVDVFGVYSGSNQYPGSRRNGVQFYDASGNYWMFGGYGCGESAMGELNDMWKWNVGTSTWSFIGGAKNPGGSASFAGETPLSSTRWPLGRDGSASWYDSTDEVVVVFGGNAGTYYTDDIWVFNFTQFAIKTPCCCGPICGNHSTRFPPVSSLNQVGPGARAYASSWMDNSGNMMLFGGYGFDTFGKLGELNDLFLYKRTTNLWTYIGGNATCNAATIISPTYSWPGGRDSAVWWTLGTGDFVMFGGYAGGASGYLQEMWKIRPPCPGCNFSIVRRPTVGTPPPTPVARFGAVGWSQGTTNYLFGGYGESGFLNDLWAWNTTDTLSWFEEYAGTHTPSPPSSWPNQRYYSIGWQSSGGNYYLFSGYGNNGGESGVMNDLWELS